MQDVDDAHSANTFALNSLRDVITSLQSQITTLVSHKDVVQTDLKLLYSNHDILKSSVNGVEKRLDQCDTMVSDVREDVENLRDAGYFDDSLDAILEKERTMVNSDLLAIKANVQAVENSLQTLLLAMENGNLDGNIKGEFYFYCITDQAF
jgi:chromosome segregation ATPase